MYISLGQYEVQELFVVLQYLLLHKNNFNILIKSKQKNKKLSCQTLGLQ